MDTPTLIANVINYTDNVSAADADNTTRRLRVLLAAQEVCDEVWNHAPWPFSYRRTTVAITAGVGSLPADFQYFGKYGRVYDDTGRPMTERPFEEVNDLTELSQGTLQDGIYTIFDQDTTTGQKKIQLPSAVTGISIIIRYKTIAPTLVDTAGNASKLVLIPVSYHHTVMLPGVVAKIRKSKGDGRDWKGDYLFGLSKMMAMERILQSTIQQLPMAVGGMS